MKSGGMKKIKAREFDEAFEKRDVTKHLDLKTAKLRRTAQSKRKDPATEDIKKGRVTKTKNLTELFRILDS